MTVAAIVMALFIIAFVITIMSQKRDSDTLRHSLEASIIAREDLNNQLVKALEDLRGATDLLDTIESARLALARDYDEKA